MKKAKQKYYVVWVGHKPGIYTDWDTCKQQVAGFAGAKYKSFESESAAQTAFKEPPPTYNGRKGTKRTSTTALPDNPPDYRHDTVLPLPPEVSASAIAVDAACSGNPGKMEYRGVDLATGQEIFHYGPVFGTNNVGEFLAIVHGLALLKQQQSDKTIYSDSRNAMLWVKNRKCKTTLQRNSRTDKLFQLIERAEHWLANNTINTPIVKWKTELWGEIPADFGRK